MDFEFSFQGIPLETKKLQLSKPLIWDSGFPLSHVLVEREINILSYPVEAALFAMEFGIATNIAGGTHHAFSDRGEGFCLLNDLAITANYLLENHLAQKVLVIDWDVDVLESDQLGRLSLTIDGIKQRDKTVLNLAQCFKIPIICFMG